MKPEGMSAGELAGKRFLTTKILVGIQEETISLFPLDVVVIGCDAGKNCRCLASSLMTQRMTGGERENKLWTLIIFLSHRIN